MKKKLLCLFFALCMAAAAAATAPSACAEIPAGVKDSYAYGTRDGSIITVKKRLEELGYFEKGTQYSNYVSEGLKETVIIFQLKNGMEQDGVLDRELLELLFSDRAKDVSGIARAAAAAEAEPPAPGPEEGAEPFAEIPPEEEAAEEPEPAEPAEPDGPAGGAAEAPEAEPDAAEPAPEEDSRSRDITLIIAGSALLAVLLVVGIIVSRPKIYDISAELERIERLSGEPFMRWCAQLLLNLGCDRVRAADPSEGFGADLIFYVNGEKAAAQCKRFIKPVGARSVQEIIIAGEHYGAKRLVILTCNSFTDSAVRLARQYGVALWGPAELKKKMADANRLYAGEKRRRRGTDSPAAPSDRKGAEKR